MPSDYQTRKRFRIANTYPYENWFEGGSPGGVYAYENPSMTSYSFESLYSRRNGWTLRSNHDRDIGGNFTKLTYTELHTPEYVNLRAGPVNYRFVGPILGTQPLASTKIESSFAALTLSDAALTTLGTGFVSEASPTKPRAGLTVALTELKREGIPKLTSEAFSSFFAKNFGKSGKALSGDYLNWQFGWVPLVSDLRALAKSVLDADYLLSQLYRDNGRVIHRSRGNRDYERVISENSSIVGSYVVAPPPMNAYFYVRQGQLFTGERITRSTWFSGAFTYHIPKDVVGLKGLQRILVEARYLYGLSVSPIDVWNLVPWTWLVDWIFNAGQILSSLSDQIYNTQVLKYGYVMARTKQVTTYHTSQMLQQPFTVVTGRSVCTWDVKQRLAATPFGFGLSWSGFTPYQLSILTALGLSRGR